ncbi:hypothetical protein IC620_10910 [Hazenella sp. IB182357]|uniref:Uncharacterized protein n=1 Tax=Polycladospora coralii TaxID=2771432 RepID=A0A926N6X4_9BACL|nr:hypothetical protein [Polycladospora coralii]MBD1372866.1 hypothetical protein [Polycladospora coralii]MBS7529445.1 hypothetical protein [Polycladospora coralii]
MFTYSSQPLPTKTGYRQVLERSYQRARHKMERMIEEPHRFTQEEIEALQAYLAQLEKEMYLYH